MSKFHVQDSLYFERLEDGSVDITFPGGGSLTLGDSSWASVVSSMCLRGEDHVTYNEALTFHNKKA